MPNSNDQPPNYPIKLDETLKRESRSVVALYGLSLAESIRVLLDAVRKRDKRALAILDEASKKK